MIDLKSKYTVLHDDNGSFSNYTEDAADLTRDNFNMSLVASEDYLYVGLHKPFNSAYFEVFAANVNANSFSAEVYNGTSWVSTTLTDESKGWTRSGFMFWDKSDMKVVTVNSIEAYYVRLKPSADHSATTLRGINLVFADDAALKQEFNEITNSNILPTGEVSHITTHVSTRNFILHNLRNNYVKSTTGVSLAMVNEKINQFDLIDIFEIREAAVFLSLSKIFFNLSDNPEDHWWLKYREYLDKYEEKMKVARLSVDSNNDGVDDGEEKQYQFQPTRWLR